MKFVLAVTLLVFAAVVRADDVASKLDDKVKEAVRKNVGECIDQEKVTKEAVQELRVGNFDNVDDKLKCFSHCFLEKSGLTVDGVVKDDVVAAKLGPIVGEEQIKTIMQSCNTISGTDKCDKAFKLYECYYKQKAAVI